MSDPVKIVVMGAGSRSFGRGALVDTLMCEALRDRKVTLTLVDVDEGALARMAGLARVLNEHLGSPLTIEATTDRAQALPGADYVITSVTVQRYPLWEQDFRVPMAFGFRHVLGENGGPGALFHALRNYEIILPICRDVERLCPDALLLNFTNPESRILMAICHLTKVRAVGLCHGVLGARNRAAQILDRPLASLDMVTGGLNHFFWFLKIADAKTGEDLYPELRRRIVSGEVSVPPLVRKVVEVFDHFTYPSDDHIGEYLAFAHEFVDGRWHYGQECRPVPRPGPRPAEEEDWTAPYLDGRKPAAELLRASGELSLEIIADIECDRKAWQPTVNVLNDDGYVANLQREAIVEVPATVDAGGVHPEHVGPIPEPLAAFCRTQVTIQQLLIEAYHERSKKLLLQALLLDPVVDSVAQAEKLLETMLELQKEFLPAFA